MRVLLCDDDLGRWAPGHDGTMDSEGLALAYAYPELTEAQSWVRANFISSLDGAATGDDGRSGSINTGADRDVFGLAPWLEHRAGRPAHPTIAVVSRSGDIPPQLSQARENSGEVLLVTCARAGDKAIDLARGTLGEENVIVEGDVSVDLASALDALSVRGLRRILCEGGPHLMRDLTASGRLDELCLTLAPMVVAGDHPRITAGASVTANLLPRLLIESQGTILGRWSRA